MFGSKISSRCTRRCFYAPQASIVSMAFAPPNYAVTTDGLPLVTEWSSVLSTDWSRINPANPLAFFLQPLVPLAAVALYLLSEPVFDRLRLALDVQPKSPALVYSIALHNVILAVFSGWVAVYTWPLFTRALAQGGTAYPRSSSSRTTCEPM